LELQHTNLIEANRQIDARRHFSEVIISGVSAGILALDINKEVSMINPQAKAILKINNSNNLSDLVKIFPEVINLLSNLEKNQEESIHEQINISRNNQNIILFVRIIVEILNKEILGYIITFDDVTKLIIAQRSAAWSDVARKVAHEIKNPLTPIHLASQRLQTKYSDEVSDKITFLKYTNTIIKHVSQIGKMVEEFVFFARMPSPQFAFNDVNNIVRDIIFSRECIEHGIKYSLVELANSVVIYSDKEQLSRAFTNLLKNAEESFLDIRNPGNDKKIEVTISKTNKYAIIFIEDSGPGFPENLFNQLTEPYITNKIGGSGLGLAIVKKIIDDHDGIMELINKESGGAKVELLFKLNQNKEQK
jgi:two-component system nitrogen regulation sensor histidine kinase NtrY